MSNAIRSTVLVISLEITQPVDKAMYYGGVTSLNKIQYRCP